jgi:hypothetical protein
MEAGNPRSPTASLNVAVKAARTANAWLRLNRPLVEEIKSVAKLLGVLCGAVYIVWQYSDRLDMDRISKSHDHIKEFRSSDAQKSGTLEMFDVLLANKKIAEQRDTAIAAVRKTKTLCPLNEFYVNVHDGDALSKQLVALSEPLEYFLSCANSNACDIGLMCQFMGWRVKKFYNASCSVYMLMEFDMYQDMTTSIKRFIKRCEAHFAANKTDLEYDSESYCDFYLKSTKKTARQLIECPK